MQFITLFFIFIMAAIVIFPPMTAAYFARYPLPQKAKKRADKCQKKRNKHKQRAAIQTNFRTPKHSNQKWTFKALQDLSRLN